MKVKELREILANYPDDHPVIMAKDGEGNNFSPLADYSDDLKYLPESTWAGEVYSPEDLEDYEEDDPYREGMQDCVVLWPVN